MPSLPTFSPARQRSGFAGIKGGIVNVEGGFPSAVFPLRHATKDGAADSIGFARSFPGGGFA